MRGYFTRLAKQSGVAINASNPSARARPGPLPRVPPDGTSPSLHLETVDLVDSLPPGEEVTRQATRSDPKISSESEQAGRQVAVSDVFNPPFSTPSRTGFFRQRSTRSLALEKAGESESEVAALSSEALEKESGGKGGVVRVGERASSIEQKFASDYLEGVREWLSSPPNRIEAIQSSEAEANPRKAFTAFEQEVGSLVPNFSDRDPASQNDIQEFSLSIGSISIVVEEPAQQPKQRPNSVQPIESASVSTQPRARDAFALSRSYFRGF